MTLHRVLTTILMFQLNPAWAASTGFTIPAGPPQTPPAQAPAPQTTCDSGKMATDPKEIEQMAKSQLNYSDIFNMERKMQGDEKHRDCFTRLLAPNDTSVSLQLSCVLDDGTKIKTSFAASACVLGRGMIEIKIDSNDLATQFMQWTGKAYGELTVLSTGVENQVTIRLPQLGSSPSKDILFRSVPVATTADGNGVR